MITRRIFLATGATAAAAAALPRPLRAQPGKLFRNLPASLAQLEKSSGGRLGVAVLDTASGEKTGHRLDERFAMCSTFKMLLVGAVLQRADTGREHMDRAVSIPAKPLVSHSPLTEGHAGGEMTVSALCHAAITESDNTAANLLLNILTGPGGITQFARSIGDTVTRLDRTETTLNEATPGDPRDTTSPAAMATDMQTLLLGTVLTPPSRDQLIQWMIENKYGGERLRAALPHDWRAGDKTGSNGETTSNDIAIYWPPHRAPVLVAAYLTECPGPETKRSSALAEVGRLVVSTVQSS
jgi:beta-lactamase class A